MYFAILKEINSIVNFIKFSILYIFYHFYPINLPYNSTLWLHFESAGCVCGMFWGLYQLVIKNIQYFLSAISDLTFELDIKTQSRDVEKEESILRLEASRNYPKDKRDS